ncbi:MAG: immune inhibitor A [Chloroflexi bacterium]|nr:immune inhibitor A [Chloroflexota bacterium]
MRVLRLLAALTVLLTGGWGQSEDDAALRWAMAESQASEPLPRDLDELAGLYLMGADVTRLVNYDPPDYRLGRRDGFWVADDDPPRHFRVEADLRHISRHAYWYVQSGMNVPDDALRRASGSFERVIYPKVRSLVGSEAFPGIDNDHRITILNGAVPGVAGYVSSADGYSKAAAPFSNEREMVYLNVRSLEVGSAVYLGVLAHEFTHLVHGNVNMRESTWLKEGLADAVSFLLIPGRGISYSAFLAHTDLPLTSWSEGPAGSDYYEAAALFVRYFVDRFGQGAVRSLVSQDGYGFDRLDRAISRLGGPVSFDELFAEWSVANVSGGTSSPGVPRYQRPLDRAPRMLRLAAGATIEQTVSQFGLDYIEILDPTRTLQFSGDATVPTLGTPPRDGFSMWHGGRADASVATLTRSVDLSGLDSAEVRFWTWYDIEKDYDFAYVSASTDGGRSWTLLRAPSMSVANGTGNNLGAGFTGRSGGGEQPEWLPVTLDLTGYAGRPVLVQFSYITDDAIARDGIALDEIEVFPLPEVDGAEAGNSSWASRGWTRVSSAVPQSWAVQVVGFSGPEVTVDQVYIDQDGRGSWSSRGRKIDSAIAIVSGLNRETSRTVSYSLRLDAGVGT